MATVPTPEESARAILAIFKSKNVHAGAILMGGQVNMQFLNDGGKADDYNGGLKYARDKGWVEPATGGTGLRLTQAGFDEM